ncbi:uncharacterized protein K441DRAFT_593263 [Cenococcum geophilum 1.58]|uniref:Uncharacterized protein n=1 Tax=Cenococcum geophilum 1.58 TaxID=794803 RepID=A0ACC8EMS3_9PEZI|nr:hypothetical protein K441DRAFT_593263 [Cenococcum geophilum 1.58]
MHTPILPKAGFDLEGIPPKLIVIGVDFGTTYTGVAFSTLDWPEPRVINNWPSPRRIHVENKVPTSVAYRAGRKRINWGFECPAPAEIRPGMAVWDTFKLFLDPLFLKEVCDHCKDEDLDFMPTNEDVQMWFEDFLTELYQYIVAYITKYFQLKDWEAARVVYSFSVPAIWSSRIEVVKTFEDIIRKAGFGKSKQHIVKIELTEAEAAAVYTARSWKDHYAVAQPGKPLEEAAGIRQGSVLVVCDAGGGTTDTSVLKVNSIKPFRDSNGNEEVIAGLEQLDSLLGKATGSVQIDEAFQREVERRNNRLGWGNNTAKDVIKSMAEDMTKSRRGMSFQHLKKIFGTKLFTDNIKVQLPDLFKNFNYPEVGVEGGRMTFTYDDIKAMFDEQVYSIFKLIDDQLERLRKIDPSQQVSHFVISGGLGSSKYVQDCIMRRFGPIPGGHRIEILVARDPQLSVCKGLVIDHIYSVNYANFILSTMCSRVSYGILFNEPYNKIQHPGPPYKGPVDRKDYGLNQIRWLVRAGKPIRRDKPISRTFYRIADPKIERTIICSDTIVSSSAPVDYLPRSINEGGAVRAYQIKSKLDLNALKQEDYVERQQRMKFLGLKAKSYWEIEHTILVYTGVADLRFQIRVGKNVIGEASLIPIIWMHERDARQDGVVSGEEMEDEDSKLFEIQDEQEQIKLRALPRTW